VFKKMADLPGDIARAFSLRPHAGKDACFVDRVGVNPDFFLNADLTD
jgi:hypothetical protein